MHDEARRKFMDSVTPMSRPEVPGSVENIASWRRDAEQRLDEFLAALAASPAPKPTPGLRETLDRIREACDLPRDEIVRQYGTEQRLLFAVIPSWCDAALASPAPEPTGLDADEVRAAVEWGYRLGWQDRTKQGQGYAPTHRAAGYLAARLTGEGS